VLPILFRASRTAVSASSVQAGQLCVRGGHQQGCGVETVPGTGEVARFPAETLGTHKDGNTEHNVLGVVLCMA
jgi:hypothetical protein